MSNLMNIIYKRIDPWLFSSHRADYFDYLFSVLSGSKGNLTIRELFYRDAIRYGNNHRGRLSAQWAKSCDISAGDLYATWLGYFPIDELLLVRVSQAFGNQRLLESFRALAEHLDLLLEAKRILVATLTSAVIALLVVFLLVFALPWWTVPALQQSFNGLHDIYLGSWARNLFFFAELIKTWGVLLACLAISAVVAFFISLPNLTGRLRSYLDKFGLWKLYRQISALRFISLVVILLQPGNGMSSQLRSVVAVFLESSSPWLGQHIHHILNNIDQGAAGAQAFDTGLLDDDLYWYLTDMVLANGLQSGLAATHKRMRQTWLTQVKRHAQAIRWLCLLSGVACVMGIGLWHYAAIDDLRRAWMMFHAT